MGARSFTNLGFEEKLFKAAGKLGFLEDRTHRMLKDEEVARIADTYHVWRGTKEATYEDVPGFCKAATAEEIAKSDYVLTPGRYCGSEAVVDDGEPFAEKFARLRAQLAEQFEESARLQAVIEGSLSTLEQRP